MKGSLMLLMFGLLALIMEAGIVISVPDTSTGQQVGQIKSDIKDPTILKEGQNNLCPADSATLYLSGRRVCAKCEPMYTAVEQNGRVICIRSEVQPKMRIPDGYQPEFVPLTQDGRCPINHQPVTLYGKKLCVQCKPGYRYHPYYGQGRCITCPQGQSLNEIGGKIMCLDCPRGSILVGTHPPSNLTCVCPNPMVFAWGDHGYGCYSK
jgi:hypothetical protein